MACQALCVSKLQSTRLGRVRKNKSPVYFILVQKPYPQTGDEMALHAGLPGPQRSGSITTLYARGARVAIPYRRENTPWETFTLIKNIPELSHLHFSASFTVTHKFPDHFDLKNNGYFSFERFTR